MTVDEPSGRFETYRDRVERPLWRTVTRFGSGRRRYLVAGLFLSILEQGLSLLPPYLLGLAIDAVFNDDAVYALPLLPVDFVPTLNVFGLQQNLFELVFTVVLMGAAFVGSAVLFSARGMSLDYFSHTLMHEIRVETYQKLQHLDLAVFDEEETGELMSILNNDVSNLESFFDQALGQAARIGAVLLGVSIILFSLNAQLAVVTLLVVPILTGTTMWFMRRIEPVYDDIRSSVGGLNSRLENNLGGIQLIKSAATEDHEHDRVEAASHQYFESNWRRIKLTFLYHPGTQLLSNVSFWLTFAIGGVWVTTGQAPGPLTGDLSVGALVTFLFMSQRFTGPLRNVSSIVNLYENALASGKRIFALLDMPAHIEDATDAAELAELDGRVEYDHVTFGYGSTGKDNRSEEMGKTAGDFADDSAETDNAVIRDVSFTAEPGETIALVGPTGAGKSTVMKLLLRLYDVNDGAVRVDGHDVRSVSLASLRSRVGYVGQEAFLFGGTIRENISYGQFDATDEEIREAARIAEAHKFITELPDGYDSMVGERGVMLSGGQRQRISIARTVLQDPDVLVLDEATSDVDTETEVLIQQGLDRLAADRTTFTIAHRLSTVKDADTILVLDEGEIVERGTHGELLEADGLYANLWAVQVGNLESLPDSFLERASRRDAKY